MKQSFLSSFGFSGRKSSQLKDMTEDERIQSHERKVQKKIAQKMHKAINSMGISAQLKGPVNDKLQSVVQLPRGFWLLVDMDMLEPEFIISDDRQGNCTLLFYDNNEELLLKEIKEMFPSYSRQIMNSQ